MCVCLCVCVCKLVHRSYLPLQLVLCLNHLSACLPFIHAETHSNTVCSAASASAAPSTTVTLVCWSLPVLQSPDLHQALQHNPPAVTELAALCVKPRGL